jgi:hypothetical protein
MSNEKVDLLNKRYALSVLTLTFLLPAVLSVAEISASKYQIGSFALCGKWFIFSAVGLRLFIAGLKQTIDPAFTAKEIFRLSNPESFPIVRELGFANLCFGLTGIISLFFPQWRIVSAFSRGLYYGLAGLLHLIQKPVGKNESFALVTDLAIFVLLLIYFVKTIH